MTEMMTTTFGQEFCEDLRQLSTGHWVGMNWDGKHFTSDDHFEKGSTGGERFKHLNVRESTEVEKEEYNKIIKEWINKS